MKKKTLTASVFFAASLLATLDVQAQGSLTPPGAPAPAMKTLEQVEPRTDVAMLAGDASSEIVITNSGSYYLSANLTVEKDNGIKIAADGVTLDLNGFEISRASGSGGYGVYILVGADRATVRNGTIVGTFNRGIDDLSIGSLYEKLAVSGCMVYGIRAGESARIIDCRAHDNLGSGIYAAGGSSLDGCTAYSNQGAYGIRVYWGSTLNDCIVRDNDGTYGFHAGNGSTLSGCIAIQNKGTYGIYASSGSTLIGCSATSNEGTGSSSYGIYAGSGSTVVECAATSNSNTNSPSSSSQGVGFYVSRSTVKDCTASFNQGDGIQVHSDCLVVGGDFSGNGFDAGEGAGIHLTGSFGDNRIESNTVTDNDRGIDVDSPGNLIIRNSASGNSTDYAIIGTQTIGPIITATGTITNTNPWANFSF